MVSDSLKKIIEHYLTLTFWFRVHQDDKAISTNLFKAVLQEIGKVEDELRNRGVSETAIQILNVTSEQLYKTPIEQFSKPAQLRISKIIFGEGTKWADEKENR